MTSNEFEGLVREAVKLAEQPADLQAALDGRFGSHKGIVLFASGGARWLEDGYEAKLAEENATRQALESALVVKCRVNDLTRRGLLEPLVEALGYLAKDRELLAPAEALLRAIGEKVE